MLCHAPFRELIIKYLYDNNSMARPRNAHKAKPVTLRVTPQVLEYLNQLVGHGLYGKTPPEVASTLVNRSIEALIERGHLESLTKSKKGEKHE
jgi:hypothetical protein